MPASVRPRPASPAADPRSLLAGHGIRPTRQRQRVLEVLAAEANDATAQEIHARLRDEGDRIGLATIYRTLSLLGEQGVVDTLVHHAGESCYRLCAGGHHHHLVCTGCHRVVELRDCKLGPWLARIGAEHGFSVDAHTVEATGRCAECEGTTSQPRKSGRAADVG